MLAAVGRRYDIVGQGGSVGALSAVCSMCAGQDVPYHGLPVFVLWPWALGMSCCRELVHGTHLMWWDYDRIHASY